MRDRDCIGLNSAGTGRGARRRITAILALACILAASVQLSGSARASGGEFEFGEAEFPQAGHLEGPLGIAVDQANGDLYVGTGFGNPIRKFTGDGTSLFAFGWGVADGAEENQTCTSTCLLPLEVAGFPSSPQLAAGAAFVSPSGVAVDPTGTHDLYVRDTSFFNRIERYTASGEPLLAFGGDVVAFGPDNSNVDEVQKLTIEAEGGSFKLAFPYPFNPYSSLDPRTSSLPYDATAAEVKAALEQLSTINGTYVSGGEVGVVRSEASASKFEYQIVFEGGLGGDDVPALQIEASLTGTSATAQLQTQSAGGGPEICRPAAGDACKAAGDFGSGQNGVFSRWPGEERFSSTVAVDSAGTVYVGDGDRVQKFNAQGEYLGQIDLPVVPERPNRVKALAVDASGNTYVVIERDWSENGVEHRETSGVLEFDSAGTLVRTLTPEGTPNVLATLGSSILVGTELHRKEPADAYHFDEYDAAGVLNAQFTSPLIRNEEGPSNPVIDVPGISASSVNSMLYATNFYAPPGESPHSHAVAIPLPTSGPPAVSGLHATEIEPETATLRGVVNPRGFPTAYHFEYTTGGFSECGTAANPQCHTTPQQSLDFVNRDDPVEAPISALKPGTSYHVRLLAENQEGQETAEAQFETLPAVAVRNLTTQLVAPEEVELKAELSPDNGSNTEWEICYGPEEGNYSGGCVPGTLAVLGNAFEPISATFEHLQPNTTYHYRLTAINSYAEEVKTADQTFTTEETIAEQDAREGCANSLRREENNSLALPDCRAYEQVSPSYKAGSFATEGLLAPSGDRVMFGSQAAIDGAGSSIAPANVEYVATRTAAGWGTRPAITNVFPSGSQAEAVFAFTPELDRWQFKVVPGFSEEGTRDAASSTEIYEGSTSAAAASTGARLALVEGRPRPTIGFTRVVAQSDDLSTLIIGTAAKLLASDPRPDGGWQNVTRELQDRLYEYTGVGGAGPALSLLDEVPLHLSRYGGAESCTVDSAPAQAGASTGRRISADGSELLYTRPIEEEAGAGCGEGTPNPIGAFLAGPGLRPRQLNVAAGPWCTAPAPCASAAPRTPHLFALSPDGRRAWFTTTQPLASSDGDTSADLYLARIEGGELEDLVQASGGGEGDPSPGVGAQVQGGLEVSKDGGAVAFVARGVLTSTPNALGDAARAGADNLYVYEASSGETRFVADLCSEFGESGSVEDARCPAASPEGPPADPSTWLAGHTSGHVFTPDGRFLLFQSQGRLTRDDSDSARDVFRYDFQSGELIRVSRGRRGNDDNGNDSAFAAGLDEQAGNLEGPWQLAEDERREISDDGSTVLFTTPAPLVSRDSNEGADPGCLPQTTGCDLYEWSEDGHGSCREAGGCIGLISNGTANAQTRAVLSPSGRDVVFSTASGLVPADTDGVRDVYDARGGGGFPPPPPPEICQRAETCHGAPTNASLGLNLTTESLHSGGNGPQQPYCAKGRRRVRKHGHVRCVPNKKRHHHKKRRHHRRAARPNQGGRK